MVEYIKSPLNYIGGKHKLLKEILPYFKNSIDKFVDLFAGGFNVGINIDAEIIICNDLNKFVIDMFRYFQVTAITEILAIINDRINKFELSDTNAIGYLKLREKYNALKEPIDLFLLTCYSFNHQIRFNSKHEFNNPFGRHRSSFNNSIEKNLINFRKALKNKNIVFNSDDFMKIDYSILSSSDLVYCDPPYLISTGSYNDGSRGFKDWSQKEELQLLGLLDALNNAGVNFALSNVFYHKGLSNDALIDWSQQYNVYYLDKGYSNCNYQFKSKDLKTVEVLVTNFSKEESKCRQMELF